MNILKWFFKRHLKVGQKVRIVRCANEWIGIKGELIKITRYGEYYVRIHTGNKYHKKGAVLYFPKHIIDKDE